LELELPRLLAGFSNKPEFITWLYLMITCNVSPSSFSRWNSHHFFLNKKKKWCLAADCLFVNFIKLFFKHFYHRLLFSTTCFFFNKRKRVSRNWMMSQIFSSPWVGGEKKACFSYLKKKKTFSGTKQKLIDFFFFLNIKYILPDFPSNGSSLRDLNFTHSNF